MNYHASRAFTKASVSAVMAFLFKLFPPRIEDYDLQPTEDYDSLAKKYKDIEEAKGLLAVGCLVASWLFSYIALLGVRRFHSGLLGDVPFKLTTPVYIYLVLGMFFGFLLGFMLAEVVLSWFLGKRQLEYTAFEELKYGRIARLKVRTVFVPLCIIPILITYALLDTYLIVTPDSIVIDRFAALAPVEYSHNSVERIVSAPIWQAENSAPNKSLRIQIYFRDGALWDSQESIATDQSLEEMANFISKRSGVPIEVLNLL